MGLTHNYIDTRPGLAGPFSPPAGTEDYAEWLRQRYAKAQARDGSKTIYFGAAQRINQVIRKARHEQLTVRAFGPFAGTALAVLREIAKDDNLQGEVLG